MPCLNESFHRRAGNMQGPDSMLKTDMVLLAKSTHGDAASDASGVRGCCRGKTLGSSPRWRRISRTRVAGAGLSPLLRDMCISATKSEDSSKTSKKPGCERIFLAR